MAMKKVAQSEKKMLVWIGAVSALLTAAGGYGIYYTLGRVESENSAIAGLREKISAAKAKIKQIPGDEKDVIILRENVEEYARILPDEREITEYARTLARYCRDAGMLISTLAPDRSASSGPRAAFQPTRYRLRTQGSIWQLMQLMHLLENHPRYMQLKSLAVKAGKKDGSAVDVVHDVDLTVETYSYNKAPAGKEGVKIPNYTAKRADLEEAIHNARSRFEEKTYNFKGPNGRRDLLVDPRLPSTGVDGKGRLPRKRQQEIFDACRQLLAEILEINQMVDGSGKGPKVNIIRRFELTKELNDRITLLKTKVEQIEKEGLLSYAPLHSQLVKQVKEPLEGIVEKNRPGPKKEEFISAEALDKVRVSIEEALEAGDMELAIERFRLVQSRLGPENYGGPAREEIVAAVKGLNRKAQVALEFSRKKIKVTGRIIQPENLSLVIVNGKSFYEGDPIEEDLFVKKITRDTVEFFYKGVVLRKKI